MYAFDEIGLSTTIAMGYPGVWLVAARGNSLLSFTYALHAITELEQP